MVRQILLNRNRRIEIANAVFCGFDDSFDWTRLKDIRLRAGDHVFAKLLHGAFRFEFRKAGVQNLQEVRLFDLEDLAYPSKISCIRLPAAHRDGEKAGRDREERAV